MHISIQCQGLLAFKLILSVFLQLGFHAFTKQTNHIIILEPINKRPALNHFHELSMTSVSIDVIGAFWGAMKR